MTRRILRLFLRLVRAGKPVSVAAREAGTTPRKIRDFMAGHPKFSDLVSEAEAESLDRVEEEVLARALGGDVRAMIAVLRARRPEAWREQSEDAPEASEEWDRIAAALAKRLESQPTLPADSPAGLVPRAPLELRGSNGVISNREEPPLER